MEFQVGWRAFGWDRLPYPFVCRTPAQTLEAYEGLCVAAAKDFESRWDDDMYSTFVTLGAAEARAYICGFVGPDADKKVRVHAAVRGGLGVVMVQEPGSSVDLGGDIHLLRVAASAVGRELVAAMPRVGPGRHPKVQVHIDEFHDGDRNGDVPPASWMQTTNQQRGPKREYDRLLARPTHGYGALEAYPGPTLGDRDTGSGQEMQWADFVADGRYLISFESHTRTVSAAPVDAASLADRLQRMLSECADIHRDRLQQSEW
ncbi:MAG: ESX secretion-associated protein EspG [Mycobacteriaceae bacterium]|nr:ESX secretion-associated protein EspG [Mycobacteriaceae bacterium]